MLKFGIILIAIVASWFLCSERPETDVQVSNSKAADGGKTITEATSEVSKTNSDSKVEDGDKTIKGTADNIEGCKKSEPEPTGVTRFAGWIRLGALTALAVIVLKTL